MQALEAQSFPFGTVKTHVTSSTSIAKTQIQSVCVYGIEGFGEQGFWTQEFQSKLKERGFNLENHNQIFRGG